MSESQETRQFCRELEAGGAMTFAAIGNMRGKKGWPDRFVQHRYWCGWLEMKLDANWLTPLQQEIGLQLEKRSLYIDDSGMNIMRNYFVVRFSSTDKLIRVISSQGEEFYTTRKRGMAWLHEIGSFAREIG